MLPLTFNSETFQKFSLKNSLTQVFSIQPGVRSAVVVSDGLFIISKQAYQAADYFLIDTVALPKKEIFLIQQKTLNDYDLLVCDTISKKTSISLSEFIQILFQWEIDVSHIFLNAIYEHLNQRFSSGKIITHHDSVQILIADVVANLKILSMYDEQRSYQLTHDLMMDVVDNLMKLAGGRAYLSGSVIDFKSLIEVMNNLYF